MGNDGGTKVDLFALGVVECAACAPRTRLGLCAACLSNRSTIDTLKGAVRGLIRDKVRFRDERDDALSELRDTNARGESLKGSVRASGRLWSDIAADREQELKQVRKIAEDLGTELRDARKAISRLESVGADGWNEVRKLREALRYWRARFGENIGNDPDDPTDADFDVRDDAERTEIIDDVAGETVRMILNGASFSAYLSTGWGGIGASGQAAACVEWNAAVHHGIRRALDLAERIPAGPGADPDPQTPADPNTDAAREDLTNRLTSRMLEIVVGADEWELAVRNAIGAVLFNSDLRTVAPAADLDPQTPNVFPEGERDDETMASAAALDAVNRIIRNGLQGKLGETWRELGEGRRELIARDWRISVRSAILRAMTPKPAPAADPDPGPDERAAADLVNALAENQDLRDEMAELRRCADPAARAEMSNLDRWHATAKKLRGVEAQLERNRNVAADPRPVRANPAAETTIG